jgi:hypothetical protein
LWAAVKDADTSRDPRWAGIDAEELGGRVDALKPHELYALVDSLALEPPDQAS